MSDIFLYFTGTSIILILSALIINKFLEKSLPPGPVKWPLIGNVIELILADPVYPHLAMEKLANKYGEIMSLKMGVHNVVLISSYRAMKGILCKPEVQSRYEFLFVRDRSFKKQLGLIFGNGTMWQEVRRFSMKGLRQFGYGKPEIMDKIYQDEIKDMISFIKHSTIESDGIWHLDNQDIAASVVSILWKVVGGKFPKEDPKITRLLQLTNKQMDVLGHDNIYIAFPLLGILFPNLVNRNKHIEIHKEIQNYMKEMINELSSKRKRLEPQNFIEYMLDAVHACKDDPLSFYTEEQMIVVLMDLFLGSSETTSVSIKWAVLYLTLHPEIQKRIQNEIADVIPPNAPISIMDAHRLKYTKAVVFETLRRGNLAPLPPTREATQDVHFEGFIIPKGYAIMYNLHMIAQDADFWSDPLAFRPERFLNKTETEFVREKTERVMSLFGFGKRICPGDGLAIDSLFIYIASLLRVFTFEAIPGKEPSNKNSHYGLNLSPAPFSVTVRLRK